jgi:hypothetical protein
VSRGSGASGSRAAGSTGAAGLEEMVRDRLGLRPEESAVEACGPGGEIAVFHVPAAALEKLLEQGLREEIVRRARAEGFRYAAVDLELPGARRAGYPAG